MKKVLLIMLFSIVCFLSYSQDTIVAYLDKDFLITEKKSAVIIRTAVSNNNHYYVTDKYSNGGMLNYCEYISIDPWIEDGIAKHYNNDSKLYSRGNYVRGKMTGKWIYYSYEKIDTVDYTTVKYYFRFLKDSCKNIQRKNDSIVSIDTIELKNKLSTFIKKNLQLPARKRDISKSSTLYSRFYLDVDGLVKCPVILNSTNSDLIYESLRVLFLFKSDLKIDRPINLTIPIIFNDSSIEEPAFVIVDESATFQGGDINDFRKYIQKQMIYPTEAAVAGIQGKVIVQFAVNSNGFVVDSKILRSVNPILDNEVLRCLNNSPKWQPGIIKGKTVKQQFLIPLIFSLK